MGAIQKIRHFFSDQKEYSDAIRTIAKDYRRPVAAVRMDTLWCRFVYGAPVSQYIGFNMFQMNRHERNRYITDGRSRKLVRVLNNVSDDERAMLDQKQLFNKAFHKFVKRQWIYVPDCSDEEILSFLERHETIIAKPADEKQGRGVCKLNSPDVLKDKAVFIDQARKQRMLLEEYVQQHPAMNAVNPSSLNTIRVATVRSKDGEVSILGASLRGGGAGSVVDNLHAGGVQYPIDVQLGVVVRGGMTFDGEKDILVHPSTQQVMIGFQIPNWDQVISMVKEAAAIPEHLRYVGWDVAVTEDGCEIIEANASQGCNGMQQDGVGKYSKVKSYL